MKKLLIVVTAIALLLSGCKKEQAEQTVAGPAQQADGQTDESISSDTLTLVYNPLSSLNPLTTNNRTNSDLAPLIFDSLFTLDKNLKPSPVIASSIITNDNIHFTLNIRPNIYLHSGRLLTTADVKYTIDTILNNADSIYHQRASGIASCEETGDNSLSITLYSPNGLFSSLLDFPIIPKGMSDSSPDGSGRYRFVKLGENSAQLQANDAYYTGEKPAVRTINLKTVKDSDEAASLFNDGSISLMRVVREESATLDLKNSKIVSSLVNSNLMYIGVNVYRIRDSRIRRAVSAYADRIGLSDFYNGNRLYVSYTAFSPMWYLADESSADQNDLASASALLDESGYKLGTDGIRRSAWGGKLTFSLMVNSDNFERVSLAEKLADNLLKAGIILEIAEKPFDEYKQAIASGSYDLYLGEVKLQNDMDLRLLLGSSGSLNHGGYRSTAADNAMNTLRNAKTDDERKSAVKELTGILNTDMPIIPLFFTTTSIVGHSSDSLTLSPTVSSLWNGIWGSIQQ